MNKGGISAIVATVMVILITVAGVAIIWVGIVPMIQENVGFEELSGRVSVVSSGGYTVYDADAEVAIVQVKRDFDDGVMDRIRIIFSIGGNSYSSSVVAPEPGQTKTYTFDMAGYGAPDYVSVVPIFVSSSGSEKEGVVTSEVEVPVGSISDVGSIVEQYDLGEDYYTDTASPGLVSYWEFDGNYLDSVGGNDGVAYGDANVDGGVLNLDGDGDWVDVPYNDNLIPSDFTISSWIYPISLGTIRGVYKSAGGNGYTSGWLLYSRGTSSGLRWGDGINYNDSISLSTSPNLWSHITATFDGTIFKIYLNGVEGASESNFNFSYSETGSAQIGISSGVSSFNGSIDNVRIYNRALSEEEIREIYRKESGYDELVGSAVSWWKFDGDFLDSVGGNHGTANGAIIVDNVAVFDGDSWVVVSHNDDLQLAYGSWSLWMLADVVQCGGVKVGCVPRILRKIDSNGGFEISLSYTATPPSGQSIFAHEGLGAGGWDESLYSNSLYSFAVSQEWVHVVNIMDENDISLVYINGELENFKDWSSVGLILPTSADLLIGGLGYTYKSNFNGSMDDVMIFDKVLTQEEINAIYNNQRK